MQSYFNTVQELNYDVRKENSRPTLSSLFRHQETIGTFGVTKIVFIWIYLFIIHVKDKQLKLILTPAPLMWTSNLSGYHHHMSGLEDKHFWNQHVHDQSWSFDKN